MEKRTFSSLYGSHLSNNDTYTLVKSTGDFAIAVKMDLGDMICEVLARMLAENDSLGMHLNKSTKSLFTGQLDDLSLNRENSYSDIKRTITYHFKGRNQVKKAAAQTLRHFFDPYWDATKEMSVTVTGIFFDMLAKYHARPDLIDAANVLTLEQDLENLETINTTFYTIYNKRVQETGEREISGSKLKPKVFAEYNQFCTAVELAVNFTPNDSLISLFNSMDALRKKYHILVSKTKNNHTDETIKS